MPRAEKIENTQLYTKRVIPVSYTHLDVYKRQVNYWVESQFQVSYVLQFILKSFYRKEKSVGTSTPVSFLSSPL